MDKICNILFVCLIIAPCLGQNNSRIEIKNDSEIYLNLLTAHAGLTGALSYNTESQVLTIAGMEHLGFGAGEKVGFKLEIPNYFTW